MIEFVGYFMSHVAISEVMVFDALVSTLYCVKELFIYSYCYLFSIYCGLNLP